MEDSVDLLMSTSITLIRTMKAQIKTLEKGIQNLIKSLPIAKRTIDTIPGIGPIFSAGIIAEVGQIDRFQNEAKLAKYAGLYWRKHQSGTFTAEDTKLSRTGNVYLRYY
ncbi:mobile element protein [Sporolactobacillus inulinus]|uniref:Mobile element protein n=1 Tax=Sporolactobacillus inulinus TaxID=2078 RepID=A0A4Y1ZKM9_9BACL|nr:mobile element protein [Sporolactobacillus inulinus]